MKQFTTSTLAAVDGMPALLAVVKGSEEIIFNALGKWDAGDHSQKYGNTNTVIFSKYERYYVYHCNGSYRIGGNRRGDNFQRLLHALGGE